MRYTANENGAASFEIEGDERDFTGWTLQVRLLPHQEPDRAPINIEEGGQGPGARYSIPLPRNLTPGTYRVQLRGIDPGGEEYFLAPEPGEDLFLTIDAR